MQNCEMSGHLEINIEPGQEFPESALVFSVENEGGFFFPSIEESRECRICQEEDSVNNLESPCACSGSLNYAHRKCVQFWCNEKGNTTCEICHEPYQSGYTALSPPSAFDETTINIGGLWHITGNPSEHELIEAHYDVENSCGKVLFRTALLVLMGLLLLRHALALTDGEADSSSIIFSMFWVRILGFLLPCCILIWAVTFRRRRREEPPRFTIVVRPSGEGLRGDGTHTVSMVVGRYRTVPLSMLAPQDL